MKKVTYLGATGRHDALTPSLLDRLMDEAVDGAERSGPGLYKAALLRDLENLLNTRIFQQADISAYSELTQSLLAYGLPDFSRIQFELEADRQAFAEQVQETIVQYEPRLSAVQVTLAPVKNTYERILYLRIMASIKRAPEPIPIVLESQVRGLDRSVRLQELPYG